MSTTVGLDLGGTTILAVRLQHGEIQQSFELPTPQTGYQGVVAALTQAANAVTASDTVGIGLCAPGPFDYETGVITFSPNIPGLAGKPLVNDVSTATNLPVVLENDANAAAYAEHLRGAARGAKSSVFVTVSTGIGAGIIIGNRILRGAHGIAGEIGHMSLLPGAAIGTDGHAGTLETLASGRALARDATYIFGEDVSTKQLFARAADGDGLAERVLVQAADHIGIGMANLSKIIDPERFVFGGSVVTHNPAFFAAIIERTKVHSAGFVTPPMVLATLGAAAGAIGVAMLAQQPAAVYGVGEH